MIKSIENCNPFKINSEHKNQRAINHRIEPKLFPVKYALGTNKAAKTFAFLWKLACMLLEQVNNQHEDFQFDTRNWNFDLDNKVPFVNLSSSFPIVHLIDKDWLKQNFIWSVVSLKNTCIFTFGFPGLHSAGCSTDTFWNNFIFRRRYKMWRWNACTYW